MSTPIWRLSLSVFFFSHISSCFLQLPPRFCCVSSLWRWSRRRRRPCGARGTSRDDRAASTSTVVACKFTNDGQEVGRVRPVPAHQTCTRRSDAPAYRTLYATRRRISYDRLRRLESLSLHDKVSYSPWWCRVYPDCRQRPARTDGRGPGCNGLLQQSCYDENYQKKIKRNLYRSLCDLYGSVCYGTPLVLCWWKRGATLSRKVRDFCLYCICTLNHQFLDIHALCTASVPRHLYPLPGLRALQPDEVLPLQAIR